MLRHGIGLGLLFISSVVGAQQAPLLMTVGQQQYVATGGSCGLNAYSSSDPLVVSIQQVNASLYLFQALKAGSATITRNCMASISNYVLSVQGAEYQTFACPAEIASTFVVPEGWKVEQKQPRVFSFSRAEVAPERLACVYGAGEEVVLTRRLQGRCSLSPNRKGAYCQP